MGTKKVNDLGDRELRRLLYDIEHLGKVQIQPLSDDEVEAIESSYEPLTFSAEREKRHQNQLEEMRQEYISEIKDIDGIIHRVDELRIPREELSQTLKIGLDILFKVDLHLISNVPDQFIRRLAREINIDIRSLYAYLSEPPKGHHEMAASSKDKPAPSYIQTWEDAILASDMPNKDKQYWLEP